MICVPVKGLLITTAELEAGRYRDGLNTLLDERVASILLSYFNPRASSSG